MEFMQSHQEHELLDEKSKLINKTLTDSTPLSAEKTRPSSRKSRLSKLLKIEQALAKIKQYYSN